MTINFLELTDSEKKKAAADIIGNRATKFELSNGEKLLIVDCDSPADFANNVSKYHSKDARPEWRFGSAKNRENTLSAADAGLVPEAALAASEKAEQVAYKVGAKLPSSANVNVQRVGGAFGTFNITQYLDGNPDCFNRMKQNGRKRVVRLGINFALSCGNSEEEFHKVTGTALGIAKALERLGYGTEIVAFGYVEGNGGFAVRFPLKKAEHRFDPGKVACVGYPGFLRDLFFVYADASYSLKLQRAAHDDSSYGKCREAGSLVLEAAKIDAMVTAAWNDLGTEQLETRITGLVEQLTKGRK